MEYSTNHDIVIIGGGPAGMMAACAAAENGAAVCLLEPNERLGKKLNITGKGRCNVTNSCGPDEFLRHVPCNGRFLYSAIARFDSSSVIDFFETQGVPLKTERGNRVFPVSGRAFDISGALERYMRRLGVQAVRDRAQALAISDGALTGVKGEKGSYGAPRVIIATGGISYPLTGSTGDGYRLARSAGHTVTELRGSLVPLCAAGDLCPKLQGLSLRNVSVRVFENNKKIYSDFGEMLFTHFGVSGPVILSASAHMRHFNKKQYRLEIDLKPALDEGALDKRLVSDFTKYANSDFINALQDLLPRKLMEPFAELTGIPLRQKAHDLTREQRRRVLTLLKAMPVEITGPRPAAEAIVTSGGVAVREIDPSTMESKRLPGLYFAGEVIDVDAYTGGFNLQIAWSTGHLAGTSAARSGG
ncbi:MAG: NAD(P)/FAD-dependent oxidoreductase [Oscillospiraceae bacterium]|nr:NAD(P)/FAD-dependent oxidoreductase [Oscillospiraceae bacterium]